MATATEVHLPKDHDAHFPDRCTICGAGSPDSTLPLKTDRSGWWAFGWLAWFSRESFAVDVPACRNCAQWLRLQRFFDALLLIVVAGGAVWLAWPHIHHLRRTGLKLAMCGVAAVAVIPFLLWRAFHPYPIGLSATAKSLVYEFRDKESAREFAALNQDARSVEIK
jgi:hypothetical protein